MGDGLINDIMEKRRITTKPKRIRYYAMQFLAYYYHEMFHLRYTDMSLQALKDLLNKAFASQAAKINNILEDEYIQYVRGGVEVEFTLDYFKYLDNLVFPKEEVLAFKCEDNFDNVVNYMLLTVRRAGVRPLDHPWLLARKETYYGWLNKFFNEHNPESRLQVAIDFTQWLLEEFGMDSDPNEERDESGMTPEERKALEEEIKKILGDAEMSDDEKSEAVGEAKAKAKEGKLESSPEGEEIMDSAPDRNIGRDIAPGPETKFDIETYAEVAEKEESAGFGGGDMPDPDPKVEKIVDEMGDVDNRFDDLEHKFVPVEDYVNGYGNPFTDDQMIQINQLSRRTIEAIEKVTDKERPRWLGGQERGALHIPALINRNDHKVFRQKSKMIEKTHLAISIMLDNSGSIARYGMYEAMAAATVAKAAEELGIPVEVNAFTSEYDGVYEGNTFYTWEIKNWETSHNKSILNYKPAIDLMKLDDGYSFDGNLEEVNIYYTGNRFKSKFPKHKKVMIVFCDGATTGSETKLHNIVKELSKDIYVIGIGMGTSLTHLYPHSATLTSSQFEALPKILSNLFAGFVLEK